MTLGQIIVLVTCDTSWKLEIFTKSRAITLRILNISKWKYPGAQLHMLINIPVRFHDSRSNIFWVTCYTSWKLQKFTKSRAITLKMLKIFTWKYPGAQLHMLTNILVSFHDSRSNTFSVTCDTSWKLEIFTYSKILNISTWKYPGAQLHMLINIFVRFHDCRSITFWAMCDTKREQTDWWMEGRTRVNLNAQKSTLVINAFNSLIVKNCHKTA
jgi:hypothetical protein